MQEIYYHTKPYLLIFGGIFTIGVSSNAVMTGGGAILILAGLAIWKMRN